MNNYDEKKLMYNEMLNEVQHKDTAKYTTSRKFKTDILETFLNRWPIYGDYNNLSILLQEAFDK